MTVVAGSKLGDHFLQRQGRAIAMLQAGQMELAEVELRRLFEERPDAPEVNHFLGVYEFTQQRIDEAERLISRALIFQPGNASAYANLAAVYLAGDNLSCAQACCQLALRLNPELVPALDNLAIISRSIGEFEQSISLCQRILQVEPNNLGAHKNLGLGLLKLGRTEDAIMHLLSAREEEASSDTIYNLGLSLYASGMHDLSEPVFAAGLKRYPDNAMLAHMVAATNQSAATPTRASDDFVAKLFDDYADTFEKELGDLKYRVPQLIADAVRDAFKNDVERDLRVLDLGCGTGTCGALIKDRIGYALGVDLSAGMLEKARATQAYDHLEVGELTAFLHSHTDTYDLVLSGDTFCYLGDLDAVFGLSAKRLEAGGRLIFSVEAGSAGEQGFELTKTGRYVHSEAYLRENLTKAGFGVLDMSEAELRMETGQAVQGWIVTARRD